MFLDRRNDLPIVQRYLRQVDDVIAAASLDLTRSDLAEIESAAELAGRMR
jgi:hypothetical protein